MGIILNEGTEETLLVDGEGEHMLRHTILLQ